MGSSPHTRGAPHRRPHVRGRQGIIPAYAGSTRGRRRSGWSRRDHPRIRGEHRRALSVPTSVPGSSPHTRGARTVDATGKGDERIIPAYAGSTPASRSHSEGFRDHPRIRGEHPIHAMTGTAMEGSSPHTRGALGLAQRRERVFGIIPAYAGSTPCCPSSGAPRRDHPRIRGEHQPALAGD